MGFWKQVEQRTNFLTCKLGTCTNCHRILLHLTFSNKNDMIV